MAKQSHLYMLHYSQTLKLQLFLLLFLLLPSGLLLRELWDFHKLQELSHLQISYLGLPEVLLLQHQPSTLHTLHSQYARLPVFGQLQRHLDFAKVLE